jgi:hypothetical protein
MMKALADLAAFILALGCALVFVLTITSAVMLP